MPAQQRSRHRQTGEGKKDKDGYSPVLIVGVIIISIELLYWLYWFAAGGYIWWHDAQAPLHEYLDKHAITAISHAPLVVSILIVLHAFRTLKRLKGEELEDGFIEYELAWGASFIIAFGTDLFGFGSLLIHKDSADMAWRLEFAASIATLALSCLVLLWSLWLWIATKIEMSYLSKKKKDEQPLLGFNN